MRIISLSLSLSSDRDHNQCDLAIDVTRIVLAAFAEFAVERERSRKSQLKNFSCLQAAEVHALHQKIAIGIARKAQSHSRFDA